MSCSLRKKSRRLTTRFGWGNEGEKGKKKDDEEAEKKEGETKEQEKKEGEGKREEKKEEPAWEMR